MKLSARAKADLAGYLWISPWIAGFLLFMLLPAALSAYYSLTDYPVLEAPIFVGFDNYTRMWREPDFRDAALRTLLYAAAVVPLSTMLALVLAALLCAGRRLTGFLRAAIFLPTLVPMVAAGMVWMWLLNGGYGLINRTLALIGVEGPNWLGDGPMVLVSLIIIALWGVGHSVVIYEAAMREVPPSLYEAAALDGMGPVARFWHVTLPMISPAILFNVVTLMIGSLQLFGMPAVLSKSNEGADPRAFTFFTNEMFSQAFLNGQMGYASAMAWVQLFFVLALTGLTFAVSGRLVHYRGG